MFRSTVSIRVGPVLVLLAGAAFLAAQDAGGKEARDTLVLESLVGAASFWTGDAAAFAAAVQDTPFRWVSNEKTEARAAGSPMTYLGLPVAEAVIRLKDGHPVEIFLSLYNRGDGGSLGDDAFEALAARAAEALAARAGAPAQDLGDALKGGRLRATARAWITPVFAARLDTAYSKVRDPENPRQNERPEFVNLTLFPPGSTLETLQVRRKAEAGPDDLRQRVQHADNGDVLLGGVPMVDQGQKGYCAVATMERILRYYGSGVNQHELAQQANSSGEGGTTPEALVEALRKMSLKVGLRLDELIASNAGDFFELVEDYNKQAKRDKQPLVNFGGSRVIEVAEVYASMNVDVLREVRLKSEGKVARFLRDISTNIDRGCPLAWSVQLGWVDETPKLPQASGGHMRLVIGYNPGTREILYTDSWGFGHELKRMPLEEAFLITTGLFAVEPRT